ncbi:mRNA-capping enzyme subunit alpha [Gracilariopsis chorda]|uniref:mRNA guanylyltransferase n=1 Tax=Gracilariopsis chorda TaxID=448386 RepID=A0A2V3J592_9FLOR|nr:mRNA-capping enzyme subunit alpha [Gracilariopsis chorda]|eukprot:PXF49483.1 mRNA-capping enzyme subunit alpha [Gracilariopsis chorda]
MELGLAPIPSHDPLLRQIQDHFLRLVQRATNSPDPVYRFPGTMPLTLSRRHFGMVDSNDYVALEKSDGTRYMLFAVSNNVLLIDRSMKFYAVEPYPQVLTPGFTEQQQDTILDGELTYNMITQLWEYLIYDCVAINGNTDIAQQGFRARMSAAEEYVAGPRLWAPFCAGLLRIRIKDYYEKTDIRRLFAHIKKDPHGKYLYVNNERRDGVLCNENDGVILAPVGIPYKVKRCDALLKWKPPHLNSIDFTLQLERAHDERRKEPTVKPYIAYKGERGLIRLRQVIIPSKQRRKWAADFDRFNGAVVELAYDKLAGEWRFLRVRDDKEGPNFASTVIDTLETIVESVERDEFVAHLEKPRKPIPNHEKGFVDFNKRNLAACAFRNDLFDETNDKYLVATPISLTPVPLMQPPPRRRGPRRTAVANGDKADWRDGDRLPVAYEDDV